MSSFSYVYCTYSTLIKKNRKFSSYIRKFRMEQLPSHICLTASSYMTKYLRISSYIRKPFLIYDFTTAPYEFPYIWGKFYFLFYQCIWQEILTSGFYHDSVFSGPLWGILRTFAEIFATVCLSHVSGPWGNWFVKKLQAKISCQTFFKGTFLSNEKDGVLEWGKLWILLDSLYVVLLHTWSFYNLTYCMISTIWKWMGRINKT